MDSSDLDSNELISRILHTDFGYDHLKSARLIDLRSETLLVDQDIIFYRLGHEEAWTAALMLSTPRRPTFLLRDYDVLLLCFRDDDNVFDAYNFAYSPVSGVFYYYPTCTTFFAADISADLTAVDAFAHNRFVGVMNLANVGEVEDAAAQRVMETRVIQYLAAAWKSPQMSKLLDAIAEGKDA